MQSEISDDAIHPNKVNTLVAGNFSILPEAPHIIIGSF